MRSFEILSYRMRLGRLAGAALLTLVCAAMVRFPQLGLYATVIGVPLILLFLRETFVSYPVLFTDQDVEIPLAPFGWRRKTLLLGEITHVDILSQRGVVVFTGDEQHRIHASWAMSKVRKRELMSQIRDATTVVAERDPARIERFPIGTVHHDHLEIPLNYPKLYLRRMILAMVLAGFVGFTNPMLGVFIGALMFSILGWFSYRSHQQSTVRLDREALELVGRWRVPLADIGSVIRIPMGVRLKFVSGGNRLLRFRGRPDEASASQLHRTIEQAIENARPVTTTTPPDALERLRKRDPQSQ